MRHGAVFRFRKRLDHHGYRWVKSRDIVARRVDDDYGDRHARKILLVLEVTIDGEKNVESRRSKAQQLAVLHAGPSGLSHGADFVSGKSVRSPRGTHSSRSTRIGEEVRLRLFKGGDRYRSAHGREIVQKFFERVPALDVVNQCLNGDPRTDENRSASEDVRIRMDNGLRFHTATSLTIMLLRGQLRRSSSHAARTASADTNLRCNASATAR